MKSSWERKDVSESHWLFIDTYCNQSPLLQLMKSVVACLVRRQLSEILEPPPPTPPPSTSPMDNMFTEISGSTMYSNLVWIICCSLGFLKWSRPLYQTSALAWRSPLDGYLTAAFPAQSQRKLVFRFSSHVIFRKNVLGERESEGGGVRGGGGFSRWFRNKCWLL